MESLLSTAKTRSMGILVLPEFMGMESKHFVEFVSQPNDLVLARWRDPATHRREGIWVLYSQCDIVVHGERIDVYLFDFPTSISANFDLKDLIFPVEIDGCLLIANRHFGHLKWDPDVNGPQKRSKNIQASWLAWLLTQKTPFLVATTGEEPPALTMDQLRDYLDLEPQLPILEIPSQFVVEQKYVYDLNEVKRVLAILAENIITNMAQGLD
jgi:hypothetical protein